MAQVLTMKIAGLHTSPNEYAEVPEGALLEATNIVINQASVAEPRRGLDRVEAALPAAPNNVWFYQSKLFAHCGSGTLAYYNSGAFTSISGTYAPPSTTKTRVAESNQNLYVTTSQGAFKLDAFNATPRRAGAPKALDTQASVSVSASTWLTNNYRAAYRIVWGYKDANNNLILGAPSARESFKNTSGVTKAVALRFTIPTSILTDANYANWFYQVYRSSAVDNTSADIEPSDELGLVYEGNPTASNITNKYVDVDDIVPDALRGATIYTAQSQEGLANQNEPPPLAKDIGVFKGTMFYANVTSKHRVYATLLSVSGAGLVNGDTVTVGGVTYTGAATEVIGSAQFQVVTTGSAAQNIRDTALSLVRVINRNTSSTIYAFYQSGTTDLPGKILFEERSIGGSSFTFTSSRTTAWNPSQLPKTSSNDTFKNGVFYSKPSQPEATPLPNFFEVGSKDSAIVRIVPLRDSLFVFKEDGVFRIIEDGSGYQVTRESETKLLAAESCAVLNNQIFCLTDQGVSSVSDSGGDAVISRPIESDLLTIFSQSLASVRTSAFGVAYESERKYLLFLPGSAGDSGPTVAYVWNTFTSTWVKWVMSKSCGIVGTIDVRDSTTKDMLYLGDSATSYVNIERKALNYTDHVDYGFATTITSATGTSATVGSGADNIAAGDVLYQDATHFALVTAVDAITSTITLQLNASFSVGSATVYKAISTSVAWTPVALNNPGITKQFQEVQFIFRQDYAGNATATFSSDLSYADETAILPGNSLALWGLFVWGNSVVWGGQNVRRPVRVWVPRQKQVGSYLKVKFSHAWGFTGWQLEGLSVIGETIGSTRTRR